MGSKSGADTLAPFRKLSPLYNLTGISPSKALLGTPPKEPVPTDPNAIGAAQTGTNVSTAIANALLGQVNQKGPGGSLNYSQTGDFDWTDPSSGKVYKIPRFTATTELSQTGQQTQDQIDRAGLNLAGTAADQAGRVRDTLSTPLDTNGLPARAQRDTQTAQYGADLDAPQYSTGGAPLPGTSSRAGLPQFQQLQQEAGLQTDYENDFSAGRKRVEDALYERLNPQLDRQRQMLDTSLANRGIKLGSAAYDRAIEENSKAANDARFGVIREGGAEQSRLAGLTRDEATFGNSARQQELSNRNSATSYGDDRAAQRYSMDEAARQYGDERAVQMFGLGEDQRRYGDVMQGQRFADQAAIQARGDANTNNTFNQRQALLDAQDRSRAGGMEERLALRNQPINEISALLSGSQVNSPAFGNVGGTAQIPTTDIAGLFGQNNQQLQELYNQRLGQYNSNVGAAGSAVASLLPLIFASDERLKKNIKPVFGLGKHTVYEYHFKDEPDDAPKHRGAIAQEVEKIEPDAVIDTADGIKKVNYTKVFGLAREAA